MAEKIVYDKGDGPKPYNVQKVLSESKTHVTVELVGGGVRTLKTGNIKSREDMTGGTGSGDGVDAGK